jgi:hypothetical protein
MMTCSGGCRACTVRGGVGLDGGSPPWWSASDGGTRTSVAGVVPHGRRSTREALSARAPAPAGAASSVQPTTHRTRHRSHHGRAPPGRGHLGDTGLGGEGRAKRSGLGTRPLPRGRRGGSRHALPELAYDADRGRLPDRALGRAAELPRRRRGCGSRSTTPCTPRPTAVGATVRTASTSRSRRRSTRRSRWLERSVRSASRFRTRAQRKAVSRTARSSTTQVTAPPCPTCRCPTG